MSVAAQHVFESELAHYNETGEIGKRNPWFVVISEAQAPCAAESFRRNVFNVQHSLPGCLEEAFRKPSRRAERCRGEEPRHGFIQHVVCRHPRVGLAGRAGTDSRHTSKRW